MPHPRSHSLTPIPTPTPPHHFAYDKAAQKAGLSAPALAEIIRLFETDYPSDLMLRELHILRACHSVAAGRATLAGLLSRSPTADGLAA